jgi:hypothetical protein
MDKVFYVRSENTVRLDLSLLFTYHNYCHISVVINIWNDNIEKQTGKCSLSVSSLIVS